MPTLWFLTVPTAAQVFLEIFATTTASWSVFPRICWEMPQREKGTERWALLTWSCPHLHCTAWQSRLTHPKLKPWCLLKHSSMGSKSNTNLLNTLQMWPGSNSYKDTGYGRAQLQTLTFSDGNTTLLLQVDIQTESLALPAHCPSVRMALCPPTCRRARFHLE